MSEQQQTEVKEEPKTASICPCCGKPTLQYPIKKLPDALADQFMACLISGTPFTHAYPLYNGRVVITVSQMTADMRITVEKLLHAIDRLADSGFTAENVSLENMKGIVRSLISVTSIAIKSGDNTKMFQPSDNVRKALDKFNELDPGDTDSAKLKDTVTGIYKSLTDPSEVSGVPPVQIMATIEAHARLLDILMDSGFDANFWAGIELA